LLFHELAGAVYGLQELMPLFNMREDKIFTRGDPEGLSHPLEPVIAAFTLIALTTGRYKVGRKSRTTKATRLDMIQSELFRFILFTTINTVKIKCFFDCTTV
jgi:hypothetical protein